jgi:hypothetical protein
VSCLAVVD